MSTLTWFIIMCVAGGLWLLLWFFTRPKGGINGDKD